MKVCARSVNLVCGLLLFLPCNQVVAQWAGVGKYFASDADHHDHFGRTIDADQDLVVVGAPDNDEMGLNSGAVYVLRQDANAETWIEETIIFPPYEMEEGHFGETVFIAGDLLMVSAPGASRAFIYRRTDLGETWILEGELEIGFDLTAGVAISDEFGVVGSADVTTVYQYDVQTGTWEYHSELTHSDGIHNDDFGRRVDIECDTLVVGCPRCETQSFGDGAAYAYRYDEESNTWIEQARLVGPTQSHAAFGRDVSLRGDAIVVGSASSGAHVFRYDDQSQHWALEDILVEPAGGARFGQAVDLDDGVAIGLAHDSVVMAYIFRYDPSTTRWHHERTLPRNAVFEADVALSGGLAFVSNDNDGDAAAYGGSLQVYSNIALEIAPNPPTPGASLLATASNLLPSKEAHLFASVWGKGTTEHEALSVTLDLNSPVEYLGTVTTDDSGNATWEANVPDVLKSQDTLHLQVAQRHLKTSLVGTTLMTDVTRWDQQAEIKASDVGKNDEFGIDISLSGDVAVIGSWKDGGQNTGSVYAYRRDLKTDLWIEQAKLKASDRDGDERLGESVGIDGQFVVAGAERDEDNGTRTGAAYVFQYDDQTTTWSEHTKLTPLEPHEYDRFGADVAIHQHTIVVGATDYDGNYFDSGAVYVFEYNESQDAWHEEAILIAEIGRNEEFGAAVAIDAGVIAVGAPDSSTGSVYIFRYDSSNGIWSQETLIEPSGLQSEEAFGSAVALSGHVLVVGAPGRDENSQDSGAMYVFRYDPLVATWTAETKIVPTNIGALDRLGYDVDVAGDLIIGGAPGEMSAFSNDVGRAYIYRYDSKSGQWNPQQALAREYIVEGDWLGSSVAIQDDLAWVADISDDEGKVDSGSVLIYSE